jgi:hypothetical protein
MTPLPNDACAAGDLRFVYLHWTAGDYRTTFDAYHFCVARDEADRPVVVSSRDLRANMRDVRSGTAPYAAHVAGRNSYAVGIAICAMADATPADFGTYPLRDDQVALACATAADVCRAYAIAIDADHVRTHAEAALADGYFGCAPDQRWDIARLTPSHEPLRAEEATTVGDVLRARIGAALRDRTA